MKKILALALMVIVVVIFIAVGLTAYRVAGEHQRLNADLERRSMLLAESFSEVIQPNLATNSHSNIQALVEKFADRERLAGLVVYDHKENVIAISPNLSSIKTLEIVADSMDEDQPNSMSMLVNGKLMFFLSMPLHDQEKVIGSLVVTQNASYINDRVQEIWKSSILSWFIISFLIISAVSILLILFIYKPLNRLTESAKKLTNVDDDQLGLHTPFFKPLTLEILTLKQNLLKARLSASEEARLSMERLDSPWTSDRLREYAKSILKDRSLFVISNREPFIHTKSGNSIEVSQPASGMVTALEPLMESCGGTWIAQATGNADLAVVDKNNDIKVPINNPSYTLHRIWLEKQQALSFYNGFSNEALWPLFHMAHIRPIFRDSDWKQYVAVNRIFADAVIKKIDNVKNPLIFIQDFHFALLPRMIKEVRPDSVVGLFWHIPWVTADRFSMCPTKEEFLYGMLGADVLGFHTQQHCNNFIDTTSHQLESLVDHELFTISKDNHVSWIKPFPISIDFTNEFAIKEIDATEKAWQEKTRKELGINSPYIGLGVDRLDYTKGILERFKAVEIFLMNNPKYREKFTFLQIAAPTREGVGRYREFCDEVRNEANRINASLKGNSWKPIVLIVKQYSHDQIDKFYRLCHLCMVTSLHDGMNLVAKEFVAARNDCRGVLILSSFTGASRELSDALIVNPYDGNTTAQTILQAIQMSDAQQLKRMKAMRQQVRDHNVYRWSARFLKTLVELG